MRSPVRSYCHDTIPGGFSKKACLLWFSFLNPNIRYFEWGSGFTTITADKIAMRVTSIEGSRTWYNKMREHAFSNKTRLKYVDIGKTGAFSYPKDTKKGIECFGAIDSTQDIILVDGRWRVACALSAFPFIAPTGRLMIHDFGRTNYHGILKFYIKETEHDELAVFRPKSNVSMDILNADLHRFRHDANRL